VVGARAFVEDRVDEHGRTRMTRAELASDPVREGPSLDQTPLPVWGAVGKSKAHARAMTVSPPCVEVDWLEVQASSSR
jgi:hypothetical protein